MFLQLLYSRDLKYLLSAIKINDENYFSKKNKPSTINKWADDIRKLVELDKRDIEDIKKVIDFCTSDEFWKSNILSAEKLRKHYPKLKIQMETKRKKKAAKEYGFDPDEFRLDKKCTV